MVKSFLNAIRHKEEPVPLSRQIFATIAALLFGIALGTFSKFLDTTPGNAQPFLFEYLDVGNFLGRFAIWVVIALWISVASHSPVRASVNVFVFFAGMVTSYYLYSTFVAGFFPKSYAMIWVGFTVLSPALAFICWYAKGNSKPAFLLSALLLAVLFNMTFVYGLGYFNARSLLELITFLGGILILKRNTVKATMGMCALGVAAAFILDFILPFRFF